MSLFFKIGLFPTESKSNPARIKIKNVEIPYISALIKKFKTSTIDIQGPETTQKAFVINYTSH